MTKVSLQEKINDTILHLYLISPQRLLGRRVCGLPCLDIESREVKGAGYQTTSQEAVLKFSVGVCAYPIQGVQLALQVDDNYLPVLRLNASNRFSGEVLQSSDLDPLQGNP